MVFGFSARWTTTILVLAGVVLLATVPAIAQRGFACGMGGGGCHPGKGGRLGWLKTERTAPFTADDVRLLMAAYLLRRAPDTVKVGEITIPAIGVYQVQIVTVTGAPVKTLMIDGWTGRPVPIGNPSGRGMQGKGHHGGGRGHAGPRGRGCRHGGGHGAARQPLIGRDYTAEEIRTLMRAKLLRLGNDRIQIGEISDLEDSGYWVTFLAQDKSLVQRLAIDKASGRPMALPE